MDSIVAERPLTTPDNHAPTAEEIDEQTFLSTLVQHPDRLPTFQPHKTMLWQAYNLARQAKDAHRQELGFSYINNSVEMARILVAYNLDPETVAALLLYRAMRQDPALKLDTLTQSFGKDIANLIQGVQRLEHYSRWQDDSTRLQNALMTIVSDVRTFLVQIAIRLHFMRCLNYSKREDKRQAIAQETLNVFAPLAERLGMWEIKSELEDLAFRHAHPDAYQEIASEIEGIRSTHDKILTEAISTVRRKIRNSGQSLENVIITGRPKHVYSIYRKMQSPKYQDHGVERIYDKLGVRVIVNQLSDCYMVLGLIHSHWQPIPGEFDDYIGNPRPSGYQSLHTAVRFGTGKHEVVEFQIRTHEMHYEAEYGVAAHWLYKEKTIGNAAITKKTAWLRKMIEGLKSGGADPEAVEEELSQEKIIVLTPQGEPIELLADSTPVDFAYQIHTQVGHRCRGAIVNDKMVSLDHQLQQGDSVRIITAKNGGPSRDWLIPSLGYTTKASTRSKIRRWFRTQERDKNIQFGREAVERELKRLGLSRTYSIEDIAHALHYNDLEEFLARVGFGDIQTTQIGGGIAALEQRLRRDDEEFRALLKVEPKQKGLMVKGVSGLHTTIARCCNPIPPEEVKGFVTRGRGVTIHRADCNHVLNTNEPERIIDVEWGLEEKTYPVSIIILAYDRSGLVSDIATLLKNERVNLTKAKTIVEQDVATISLVIEVTDINLLSRLLSKIEGISNVIEARRQRWN